MKYNKKNSCRNHTVMYGRKKCLINRRHLKYINPKLSNFDLIDDKGRVY